MTVNQTLNKKQVKKMRINAEKLMTERNKMNAKQIEEHFINLSPDSENYLSDLDSLLTEIQSRVDELKKKRTQLFYPMQSSKDENHNQIGLEQERNAILFLSTPQNSNSIRDKVINCLELNKIDFVSLIFEKIIPQVPKIEADWWNLDRTNPDKVKLYRFIQSTYNTFCEKRGIDEIDRELIKLNELLTQTTNKQLMEA